MKIYRFFLVVILVAVIAFGVWYVVSAYNEQRSSEKGMLVKNGIQQIGTCEERNHIEEKENIEEKARCSADAGNNIY